MKNLLIFIGLVLISHTSVAQGNLQFNQVIVFTLDIDTPQAFSVPANKVWKIESASSGYTSSSVYMRDASGNYLALLYTNNQDNRIDLPYWLPSGFTGDFRRLGNTGSGPKSTVSIIEFNVIP